MRKQADKGVPAPSSPSGQRPSGVEPVPVSSIAATPNAFERRVDFIPGYDRRDPDPHKDYGIGSVRIRFVLTGELGAVQWMIGTDWTVPSGRAHLLGFDRRYDEERKPMGWDLGYHSPRPMYENQTPMDSCDVLDGPCFYDGSGLNADLLVENFLLQGDKYVWNALEAYYRHTFEDAPWPFDDSGNIVADRLEAALSK